MLKLFAGMIIGSLVTYNVILTNDSYKDSFVDFNDWAMDKAGKLSDVFVDEVKEADPTGTLKGLWLFDITEIEAGKSYACKFRLQTVLDSEGRPAIPDSTSKASVAGSYESLGVIVKRDIDSKIVELLDTNNDLQVHHVPFENIWDVDTIEWIDPDN